MSRDPLSLLIYAIILIAAVVVLLKFSEISSLYLEEVCAGIKGR